MMRFKSIYQEAHSGKTKQVLKYRDGVPPIYTLNSLRIVRSYFSSTAAVQRVLQPHKWENAMTIDKHSWGYRRNTNLEDFYTTKELLKIMTETISCGGNILMNVGPTHDGRIDPIFQERLILVGKWLAINGDAIYSSKPWKHQNDSVSSNTWYTSKGSTVYAITLDWPSKNTLKLGSVLDLFKNSSTVVSLLGNSDKLKWSISKNLVNIQFPDKATVASMWAWVIKIQGLKSLETNEIY